MRTRGLPGRIALACAVCGALMGVSSCLWIIRPGGPFDEYERPPAPDYTQLDAWAAHPDKTDASDVDPPGVDAAVRKDQAVALSPSHGADVFFIHPTTAYTRSNWNGDFQNTTFRARTDRIIRVQASAFRGPTRIFAPLYRQATVYAFVDETGSGKKALDFAYSDVRHAFEIYLKHWNDGRPIVIAGHSQGSGHGQRLVSEFFDVPDAALRRRLVAAYLIGATLPPDSFKHIPPCKTAGSTGCWISWNTFDEKEEPAIYKERFHQSLCINPVSWEFSAADAPREMNPGGVPSDFSRVDAQITGARCDNGILRVSPTRTDGYPKSLGGGWHVMDYNFFYLSIRFNVSHRIEMFHAKGPG